MGTKPLVGLPADTVLKNNHLFHQIGDKYVRAVAEVAQCLPVMVPSLGSVLDLPVLLDRLHGLVVTGAPSNVHPAHYGAEHSPDHEPYDPLRDDTSLELIRLAIDRGMPVFGICRGLQELNVALGGTLATEIQRFEGRLDHRSLTVDDLDVKYGPRHKIRIESGGMLERILGVREIEVNSLHRQAVERLAPPLRVEATAPDGTIEAVSVRNASGFALGVQWHPEYKAQRNPDSVRLFRAFGDAVRAHAVALGEELPRTALAIGV